MPQKYVSQPKIKILEITHTSCFSSIRKTPYQPLTWTKKKRAHFKLFKISKMSFNFELYILYFWYFIANIKFILSVPPGLPRGHEALPRLIILMVTNGTSPYIYIYIYIYLSWKRTENYACGMLETYEQLCWKRTNTTHADC